MPELPEVQTVVSQLRRKIVGKRIARFGSDWRKQIFPSYAAFAKGIKRARVLGLRRFGKHIVMDLGNGYSIVAHFKMTGHFLVKDASNRQSKAFTEDSRNKYVHHIITFSDGATLEFSDMRKFGWWRAVKTTEVELLPSIASLGIDALSSKLTTKLFQGLLSRKKECPIGTVLLEQNIIAGIGNIYRSEALFLAGILPMRLIKTLTLAEWKKLLLSIKTVLRKSVKMRGTSDSDFRDTDGLVGGFQRVLCVYARAGEPCRKCGTIIMRKKLGQRSVFYCAKCQK
jgi:formamidopyrimidine-DNA glycosylase